VATAKPPGTTWNPHPLEPTRDLAVDLHKLPTAPTNLTAHVISHGTP